MGRAEIEEVARGQGPENDWPDMAGPMPDDWQPRDWQIAQMLTAGKTYREIGEELEVSGGTISSRIAMLRARYGSEFLRSPRRKRDGPPKIARLVANRRLGERERQKWSELRQLVSADFGLVSVKALRLADEVLTRYMDNPELIDTLTIEDAMVLARLAVLVGERADDMSKSLTSPMDFASGPSSMFDNLDQAASRSSRSHRAIEQVELIVQQITRTRVRTELGTSDESEDEPVEVLEASTEGTG